METSLGSELLLLSGTLPPLSPLDLELEKDEMDAEGDLDDDEGEDVDAVADPATAVGQPSSARGGSAVGTSAMAASLRRWGDEGQFTTEGQGPHNMKNLLNIIPFPHFYDILLDIFSNLLDNKL